MPNWCSNSLSVFGKTEDMKKFMEVITIDGGEYKLLEKLYPTPEELLMENVPDGQHFEQESLNLKEYGYKSWYEWRIDKWGTKWQESDLYVNQNYTEHSNGTSSIAFSFESAWAPPLEAFDKISIDYPNLLFCIYYEEPGMAFCGNCTWALGERQSESQSELISSEFDEDYLFEEYFG